MTTIYYNIQKPPTITEQIVSSALSNENDALKIISIDASNNIGYRELASINGISMCAEFYNTGTLSSSLGQNTFTQIGGQELWPLSYNSYFTTTNSTIKYIGDDAILANVSVQTCIYYSLGGVMEYTIYKNGIQQMNMYNQLQPTANLRYPVVISGILSLTKNDVLSLYVKTNASNPTYYCLVLKWSINKI